MRKGPERNGEEGYRRARLRTVEVISTYSRDLLGRRERIPIARPIPLFAPVTAAIRD
jgi:hypothetical protein